MKLEVFEQFISENDLFSFDGIIELSLNNGVTHRAVWITTLPEIKPSVDESFAGLPQSECFYLLDNKEYLVVDVAQIEAVKCLQVKYLK